MCNRKKIIIFHLCFLIIFHGAFFSGHWDAGFWTLKINVINVTVNVEAPSCTIYCSVRGVVHFLCVLFGLYLSLWKVRFHGKQIKECHKQSFCFTHCSAQKQVNAPSHALATLWGHVDRHSCQKHSFPWSAERMRLNGKCRKYQEKVSFDLLCLQVKCTSIGHAASQLEIDRPGNFFFFNHL